jgi:hypothetical protein
VGPALRWSPLQRDQVRRVWLAQGTGPERALQAKGD